jgi:small subunit ribosomal protein S20
LYIYRNLGILVDIFKGVKLANHKSALKRARQNEVKRIRNKSYKSKVKKTLKEVRTAVANNSADETKQRFPRAVSIISKAASKGIIHKNNAARKISRLARKVNQIKTS